LVHSVAFSADPLGTVPIYDVVERPTNFRTSMITYCPLQRLLADSFFRRRQQRTNPQQIEASLVWAVGGMDVWRRCARYDSVCCFIRWGWL